MLLERLQGRQGGEGMRLHHRLCHSSAFLITPVALNTVIKEEACVKGFSYWLHTSPAFYVCFLLFLLSASTTRFLCSSTCAL